MDIYDNPPSGFSRQKSGWLIKFPTSQDKKLQKLEEENKELRMMVEKILKELPSK